MQQIKQSTIKYIHNADSGDKSKIIKEKEKKVQSACMVYGA